MGSPIDYIEEGILEGNWEIVCTGFKRLTGKDLPRPSQTGDLGAIQKIHDITSTELGLDVIAEICAEEVDIETTQPLTDLSNTIKTNNPKKKKKTKKNKKKKTTKNDDSSLTLKTTKKTATQREVGTAQHITNIPDPEEVEKNKKKAAKTGRANFAKRVINKKYKVKCNECKESFESDRSDGDLGQKCKKCLSGKRSVFTK